MNKVKIAAVLFAALFFMLVAFATIALLVGLVIYGAMTVWQLILMGF